MMARPAQLLIEAFCRRGQVEQTGAWLRKRVLLPGPAYTGAGVGLGRPGRVHTYSLYIWGRSVR